jgi:ribonuclease HI
MVEDRLPRGITQMETPEVHVHFDGACQPPTGPGIAAFGFTVEGPGLDYEDSGLATPPYSEHSTNNVAEYAGAIAALEWLRRDGYRGRVVMFGDSELVVRQMTGEYAVRADHLRAYHDRLRQLAAEFASIEWRWVPREENVRADRLSKEAILDAAPEARRHRARSLPGASVSGAGGRGDADTGPPTG